MSASSFTTSMSTGSNSSKELCIVCQMQPYDLICTCGDKFDFTCIHTHVEQIGLEFQFIQNEVGQRLLQIEQIVEDINCNDAKAIVENWKRKRLQDINDIADDALNQISKREQSYSEVTPFRVQYNQLCQESHRVVHEQLTSMITLQRQILEKSDELETLPDLLHDDINLDAQIQSKLNPNIVPLQNKPVVYQTESIDSLPATLNNSGVHINTDLIPSDLTTTSNTDIIINTEATISTPKISLNENPTVNVESSVKLTNNNSSMNNFPAVSTDHDEFDAGQTANIQRQNPIVIATNNDRHAATICCQKNQLIYNDYNQRARKARLTFIPDFLRPTEKQIIDWTPPEVIVGGGDDDWIQDITYSNRLQGYLLLNRSRLRLLHGDTHELEEFYQFPDRSMKRVICNQTFIYLILAGGMTSQNGDEIILMNYDKEEKLCKTFRDIVLHRNNRMTGALVGEISDLAVNDNGQVIAAYRLERRQEVGVCLYNVSNNGNEWTIIKQLLLNECWHNDLSYTPRIEWCEKFNVFILVEYMTSHLIMLDQNGQVKGESRFTHVENGRDAPLNLSISINDWLCIRYESSINIHRLDDDRL